MQVVNEKAKSIRLLILDVDGILTTGAIYYGNHSANDTAIEFKGFHVHDGFGIKLLQSTGVQVGIISAKTSPAVSRRLADLKIEHVYLGYDEKLPAYEAMKQKLGLTDEQVAYMGDDLLDLPLLRRVGLSLTAPQAVHEVIQRVDYTTEKNAGKGAVREVCELIMNAQGSYQSVVQFYLSQ